MYYSARSVASVALAVHLIATSQFSTTLSNVRLVEAQSDLTGCEDVDTSSCDGQVTFDITRGCTSTLGREGIREFPIGGSMGRICLACSGEAKVDINTPPYFFCNSKPLCPEIRDLGGNVIKKVQPNQAKCVWVTPDKALECISSNCTENVKGVDTSKSPGDGGGEFFAISQDVTQCFIDGKKGVGITCWCSAAMALVLFLMRLPNKQLRAFPDNLITLYSLFAFMWSVNLGLGILLDYKHFSDTGLSSLCIAQGMGFEMLGMVLIFYWFIILLVMYQIIVLEISVSRVRRWQKWYHLFGWTPAIANTVVLWALPQKVFGPLPHVFTCFIRGDFIDLRIICLYAYYPLLLGGGFFFVVRIVMKLRRTGFSVYADDKCRLVSKQYIMQVLFFGIYYFYFNSIAAYYGALSVILKHFPNSLAYVKSVIYDTCLVTGYSLALIGTIVFFMFGVTLVTCQMVRQRAKEVYESVDSKMQIRRRSTKSKSGSTINDDYDTGGAAATTSRAKARAMNGENAYLSLDSGDFVKDQFSSTATSEGGIRSRQKGGEEEDDSRLSAPSDLVPRSNSHIYSDVAGDLPAYSPAPFTFITTPDNRQFKHGSVSSMTTSSYIDVDESSLGQARSKVIYAPGMGAPSAPLETVYSAPSEDDKNSEMENVLDKGEYDDDAIEDHLQQEYLDNVIAYTQETLRAQGIEMDEDLLLEYIEEIERERQKAYLDAKNERRTDDESATRTSRQTSETEQSLAVSGSIVGSADAQMAEGWSSDEDKPTTSRLSASDEAVLMGALKEAQQRASVVLQSTRESIANGTIDISARLSEMYVSGGASPATSANLKKLKKKAVTFSEAVETTEYTSAYETAAEDSSLSPRRNRSRFRRHLPPGVEALRRQGFL